jgi:hypothetical protein
VMIESVYARRMTMVAYRIASAYLRLLVGLMCHCCLVALGSIWDHCDGAGKVPCTRGAVMPRFVTPGEGQSL